MSARRARPTVSRQAELLERHGGTALGNYRPPPIVLDRGEGRHVWDVDGNGYLDIGGGVAVNSIGHGHPTLTRAICQQAARLVHSSNMYTTEVAIEIAERLTARTPFSRIFFCNSGTEANEALIKLARRVHYERGESHRIGVVSAIDSYHGRTLGSLSITGRVRHRTGMGPLLGGVSHVAYNDIAALREAIDETTAVVILETIQCDAGVFEAHPGYLAEAAAACHDVGALLMLDEVQTGYGRTGRFLSQEWHDVVPDACSIGKGMAGGFPVAAVLAKESLTGGLPPGSHASTFGGNPLACAAALAVLDVFDDEDVVACAERSGEILLAALAELVADATIPVVAVRGRGLLLGVELEDGLDPITVMQALRQAGLLVTTVADSVLRISPALTISECEIHTAVDTLREILGRARRSCQPRPDGSSEPTLGDAHDHN